MYIPFNDILNSPELFQSFVRTLAPAFRTPKYPGLLTEKYSESRKWQAVAALNGRIPMASMIDRNDGKPIIGTEKPLDLNGSMPTFGDKVVFTSEEFNKIKEIERLIASRIDQDPTELLRFMNGYLEKLLVGPLITIDKLIYEAFSNGTSTILASENRGGASMSINWGVNKSYVTIPWDQKATATGLQDLQDLYDIADDKGVTLTRFTLNRKTVRQLLAQDSVKSSLSSYFGNSRLDIKWTGTPSLEAVNIVLENNMGLPPIVIDNYKYDIVGDDGITIKSTKNAFIDGRVTGTVGMDLGNLLWTQADEEERKDTGVLYENVNHVLLSKRTDRGKVTFESELNAIPVPSAMLQDQAFILVTDATAP